MNSRTRKFLRIFEPLDDDALMMRVLHSAQNVPVVFGSYGPVARYTRRMAAKAPRPSRHLVARPDAAVNPEFLGKSGKNPPPGALWGHAGPPVPWPSFAIPIQNSV